MGGAEGVASTWCMVRFDSSSRLYGPLLISDASSYPVTPLAAFGLSGAFDKWDAINAPNLVSLSRHAPIPKPCRHGHPRGARLMVVAWSTFGPHGIGTERFPTVSSGSSFIQVVAATLRKRDRVENPDKDEGAGSSPARPTNRRVTSGNAGHSASWCQPDRIRPVWDEVLRALPIPWRYKPLSSRFVVPWLRRCSGWLVAQRC